MAVNNEIGTIQPYLKQNHWNNIKFIFILMQSKELVRNPEHDHEWPDFVTFQGTSFMRPALVLFARNGRKLAPLMNGGGQESNWRSGTENLPAIAGMAKALRLLLTDEDGKVARERAIKQRIYEHIKSFPKVTIFSQPTTGFAPHILCFTINGVRGETIVHVWRSGHLYLNNECLLIEETLGLQYFNGDACKKTLRRVLWVSLDENNTLAEADQFIKVFDQLYQKFSKLMQTHNGKELVHAVHWNHGTLWWTIDQG